MMEDFAAHDVKQYVNTKVNSITNGGKTVNVTDAEGKEVAIDCDTIIMAVGSKKNVLDVEGVNVPVYYAGDCAGEKTADIAAAIRGGYNAANQI